MLSTASFAWTLELYIVTTNTVCLSHDAVCYVISVIQTQCLTLNTSGPFILSEISRWLGFSVSPVLRLNNGSGRTWTPFLTYFENIDAKKTVLVFNKQCHFSVRHDSSVSKDVQTLSCWDCSVVSDVLTFAWRESVKAPTGENRYPVWIQTGHLLNASYSCCRSANPICALPPTQGC